ncbi:MAG: sporulation initiation factor Spo0A C-terminal domain-containing protein [Eubacteriales bacterium]|nr:sporulation initiation factor Spo0A C-terminal domain-containing protein [Eubacteriales bacterium]MDD4327067.1 sporulation initiation factor Spo0A C-terminal domain-containing protein [Eubacteriales bacterium]MDD4716734.1 sporulation initiation factor Spo0A C-terminal domain-containing protein [Eubacteriales bacterium]NCU27768.1 hypothetical protein [Candidatus Nomurabacteria bacterium]
MKIPNSSDRFVKDISFHLASSDNELVEKVSSIMKRKGHMTFSDSMGRQHYLVDGRKGVTILSNNIDGIARDLLDNNSQEAARRNKFNIESVEKVMKLSGIPGHLKGYRYIRLVLARLMENEALMSPLSKTIYPEISEKFRCTCMQIDRDVRYAVSKSILDGGKKTPKAFICYLYDVARMLATEAEEENLNRPETLQYESIE